VCRATALPGLEDCRVDNGFVQASTARGR
jgi:hypothetical protein